MQEQHVYLFLFTQRVNQIFSFGIQVFTVFLWHYLYSLKRINMEGKNYFYMIFSASLAYRSDIQIMLKNNVVTMYGDELFVDVL